jgi:hypothetical protein
LGLRHRQRAPFLQHHQKVQRPMALEPLKISLVLGKKQLGLDAPAAQAFADGAEPTGNGVERSSLAMSRLMA